MENENSTGKKRQTTVSLGDIAAEAGVTVATVSRILNAKNPERFSKETRERIAEVARRLKYRPNLAASGVRSGRTQTVGVMVPGDGAFFYPPMIGGIHDVLAEQNYAALLSWNREDIAASGSDKELQIIHRMVDRRVDGIILRPTHDDVSDMYFREVWDRGIPLVAVDRALPGVRCDFVGTDDADGGRQAARHLLGLGHRRLGQLAGPERVSTSRDRRHGFEEVVADFGDGATYTTLECPLFHKVYREAMDLLQRTPRVTAVFCASDEAAAELYEAAAELGLRIPRDLSVVGFADLLVATYLRPQLTTLRQDPYQIGQKAAQLLLERLGHEFQARESLNVRVKTELVVRGSTAPVKGRRTAH